MIVSREDFVYESRMSRAEMESFILSHIAGVSDEILGNVVNVLRGGASGGGNSLIRKAFQKLTKAEWNNMDPISRRDWFLSKNPSLGDSIRGQSFLSMITNNDFGSAKRNIQNFLESYDVRYIKKLNEKTLRELSDGPVPDMDATWLNKKSRAELIDAIGKELANASNIMLKNIYHNLLSGPVDDYIERLKTTLYNLVNDLGEKKWDSMSYEERKEYLINHSPELVVKDGGFLEFCYGRMSEFDFDTARANIPLLPDNRSNYN